MTLNTIEKIGVGVIAATLSGLVIAGTIALCGGAGVRNKEIKYSSIYRGRPALVIKENVRCGLDNLYLDFYGGRISEGTLKMDDNTFITVRDSSLDYDVENCSCRN